MRNFTGRLVALLLVTTAAFADRAQEIKQYVTQCQNELHFAASDVNSMNCNDGPNFAFGVPVNDFLVYQRVNQNVDMVAACRWGDGTQYGANSKFLSIEMLMHNRQTGGTCFFAANDTAPDSDAKRNIDTVIVSPTSPNAANFWMTPTELDNKLLHSDGSSGPLEHVRCVRCHSQGPYIASLRIAPYLASFGLLNDGHDTQVDFSASKHYYVVGSQDPSVTTAGSFPFGNWNYLVKHNDENDTGNCSSGCHNLAREVDMPSDSFAYIRDLYPTKATFDSQVILPAIKSDRFELAESPVILPHPMAPNQDDSAWRWINADEPSDGVDVETFTSSKNQFPVINRYCGAPGYLEASAVGSRSVFSSATMAFIPDKLRAFNLREGLVCMNADQPNGNKCYDYAVSYKCANDGPDEIWTPFYNKDTTTTDDGDHEERSKAIGQATAFCGAAPVAIRAQWVLTGQVINGPSDRLAQFNVSGLVCRNSDQVNGGTCANYTVRYRGCVDGVKLTKVKNSWTNPPTFGDRYLTTTNNVDGAETRAQANNYQYPSQDWYIDPVPGGNTVRLADVWSGKYLTASSNTDQATVQVKNSDSSQMRQQWVIETISGSSEVRFRNVGTGRYLTVGNYTTDPYYAPIISQSLSSQNWASQRWLVQ